jgi:hypothetical protein
MAAYKRKLRSDIPGMTGAPLPGAVDSSVGGGVQDGRISARAGGMPVVGRTATAASGEAEHEIDREQPDRWSSRCRRAAWA